jgi:hypothetical protein
MINVACVPQVYTSCGSPTTPAVSVELAGIQTFSFAPITKATAYLQSEKFDEACFQ